MNRLVTLGATLIAAAVLAGVASAADWPDSRLDTAATAIAGHPVHVYCEGDQGAWDSYFYGQGVAPWSVYGYTFIGTPVVYMAPDVCFHLHVLLDDGWADGGIAKSALAVMTLTHESIHQRGIADERQTQCLTLQLVDQVAETSFGLSQTVAVQQPVTVTRSKVVRRGGRRFVVTYQTSVLRTVQVPNPELPRFDAWIKAWNGILPPSYQGC